jgi:diguanylate cyclase (GGDEF)-like protein
VADETTLLAQAWELCYLDPQAARDLGRQVAAGGGPGAPEGHLHAALFEAREGHPAAAGPPLALARRGLDGDRRGLALCAEVQAIAMLRAGHADACAALHHEQDRNGARPVDPMLGFIAHHTRALLAVHQGAADDALRHLYAALDAAQATGWAGPRISALTELGAFHQDQFNLEDARTVCEKAFDAARDAGAMPALFSNAGKLIVTYYALGEGRQARAMVDTLLTLPRSQVGELLQAHGLHLGLGHLAVGEVAAAMACIQGGTQARSASGAGTDFRAWLEARCLLAQGQPGAARELAERSLEMRHGRPRSDTPYDTLALHRTLADAAEQCGDLATALASTRQAQKLYESLVGRSARARRLALEFSLELAQMRHQRDRALDGQRSADDDRARLEALNAALTAKALEAETLQIKLREQTLRDPLTGLHNRRYLFEMAPGLLELGRRQGTPVCVVLLDLDHFKLLNDTCGHAAGDLVLQRFSGLLTQTLRRSDLVCRHGGEEFVAVMPDIDAEEAEPVLARLLEAFQAQQSELGKRRLPRGSFSAGVAEFPRHGNTLEQLLSRADRALYGAKNHGRARIEVAPRTGFGTFS